MLAAVGRTACRCCCGDFASSQSRRVTSPARRPGNARLFSDLLWPGLVREGGPGGRNSAVPPEDSMPRLARDANGSPPWLALDVGVTQLG